jgi:hypothetical protein
MTKKPKKPPGKSRPARTAARKSSAKAPPAKTSPAKTSPAGTKARASAAQSAKRKPPARDPLDDFIDVAARAFDLPVEPEWQPAIKASLDVTLRLGALVAAFELPDEAEPAPIFGA